MSILNKINKLITEKQRIEFLDNSEKFYDTLIKFYDPDETNIDYLVYKMSEFHKMTEKEVIIKIFDDLSNLLNGRENPFVGKNSNLNIDLNNLQNGVEIEFEHTNYGGIAKLIALDHIAEYEDYYDRLKKLENECES